MCVGEQLDLHGVEPDAFPAAARTLHAVVQTGILLGAEKPSEQGDADRQRYNERCRRMDGERRVPVDVVKAGDNDIENSAARDLSSGVISGGRAAQKQQVQERHDKRGALSGQLVDVGQHLFAGPSFIPNVLEGVGRATDFVAVCFFVSGSRRPGM